MFCLNMVLRVFSHVTWNYSMKTPEHRMNGCVYIYSIWPVYTVYTVYVQNILYILHTCVYVNIEKKMYHDKIKRTTSYLPIFLQPNSRPSLCISLIRPQNHTLILQTHHFHDETEMISGLMVQSDFKMSPQQLYVSMCRWGPVLYPFVHDRNTKSAVWKPVSNINKLFICKLAV